MYGITARQICLGPLLFFTFYAGREAKFSLWAFYTSIVGLALMWYSSRKGYESELMLIYSAILSFLFLMLMPLKNPFPVQYGTLSD